MSDIKQYEPLWGSWYVDSMLGEGSYGKVYKVHREEFGKTYEAAVKMLSIPQSETELRQAKSEGLDSVSARSYFHAFVTDIVQEIALMNEFRGNSNIVSLEDHKVIEKEDEIGWDILIRMELLTTLSDYVTQKPLSTNDVIKLGIHICRALELCAVKKLIHRDLKPDNIFVSQFGDYKLGDFGIARQVERTMSGLSKKGTYTYMAPEVFKGEEYGASVDLYSLGIVMYRFLNGNRTPFLPPLPDVITPHDREEALQKRMSGEAIPPIPNIDPALNEIVLKACAYNRNERFRNATEMKTALSSLIGEESILQEQPLPILPELPKSNVSSPVNVSHSEEPSVNEKTETTISDIGEEDEYDGTLGMFSAQAAPPQVSEEETSSKTHDPLRKLSFAGIVLFALLGILSFMSGDKNDIAVFLPLYALCAVQCFLRFDNKIMNTVFLVSLAGYLAFSAFSSFRFFDYTFLILLASLLAVEAARIGKIKYRVAACVAFAVFALLSAGFIAYLAWHASYAYVVKASAVPILLLIASFAVLFLGKWTEKAIGLLTAMQFFLFIVFAAYSFNRASVFFYIVNANFIGFSPERFSWWHQGRFIGLVLQFLAFGSLLIIATKTRLPEQCFNAFEKGNKLGLFLAFIAALAVIIIGLGVIAMLSGFTL